MTTNNIHIVWNTSKDGIITRLMATLANATQWSISNTPRPDADMNLFGLYIQVAQSPQQIKSLQKTSRVAAYFSHYETERPDKMQWWHEADKLVDVRLITAPQYREYLTDSKGVTHLITPPIDARFRPHAPRIGTSGFVHKGGRKGEALWRKLVNENQHEGWAFVASGEGWGAGDVQHYPFEDVPAFMRSLDVYVCTSLTEGIPMPPLEALASGVPIVVPKRVGLLDAFLYQDGVFHYDAGNYDGLLAATHAALRWMRPITVRDTYTVDAYAQSVSDALGGDYSGNKSQHTTTPKYAPPRAVRDAQPISMRLRPSTKPTTTVPDSAVVYVAYGSNAWDCVENAVRSWAQYMSDYPIYIISDAAQFRQIAGVQYHPIEHPDRDIGGRLAKVSINDLLPDDIQHILYLDADTELVASVAWLFHALQSGYDFLICTNPPRYGLVSDGERPDNIQETHVTTEILGTGQFLQPNGGVFGFTRNDAGQALMTAWRAEWFEKWAARDQMALMRALWSKPCRVLWLTNAWNTIVRYDDRGNIHPMYCHPNDTAGILHYPMTARRWTGRIDGRLDSNAAWAQVSK